MTAPERFLPAEPAFISAVERAHCETIAQLQIACGMAGELIERVRMCKLDCTHCAGEGTVRGWAPTRKIRCAECDGSGKQALPPSAAQLELAAKQLVSLARGER